MLSFEPSLINGAVKDHRQNQECFYGLHNNFTYSTSLCHTWLATQQVWDTTTISLKATFSLLLQPFAIALERYLEFVKASSNESKEINAYLSHMSICITGIQTSYTRNCQFISKRVNNSYEQLEAHLMTQPACWSPFWEFKIVKKRDKRTGAAGHSEWNKMLNKSCSTPSSMSLKSWSASDFWALADGNLQSVHHH